MAIRKQLEAQFANQRIFEYVVPAGDKDQVREYPLNNGVLASIDGGGSNLPDSLLKQIAPDPLALAAGSEGHYTTAMSPRAKYDPTLPTPSDKKLAAGMLTNSLPSTLTLDAVAATLSVASTKPGLHITVDPAISGKQVAIYGRAHIPGDQLIRLVSRVYGLQVSTVDNKTFYVTTPRVRTFSSGRELPTEIVRVIPPSLLRALESLIDRIADSIPDVSTLTYGLPAEERIRFAAQLNRQKRERVALTAGLSWYFPADRRLIALAQTAVPAPGSAPVALTSLGPEPLRLLTVMSLGSNASAALYNLERFEPPQCLTDLSTMRIYIGCGENGTTQAITLRVGSDDASGQFKSVATTIFGRNTPN